MDMLMLDVTGLEVNSGDKVELFGPNISILEVAKIALKRKTGARGLRAILEQAMLDVMYEIPSNTKVNKVLVTKDSILGKEKPKLLEGPRSTKDGPEESQILKGQDIESAS